MGSASAGSQYPENQMNSGQQILVVDDEQDICRLVERCLAAEGYRMHTATDGQGMRSVLAKNDIKLVLLDIRLPGEDGLTLLRELRRTSTIPVIMLTAKTDVIDRVLGLESGADDYIPKPFHPRELLARVRAVLRRASEKDTTGRIASVVAFSGWQLKPVSRELVSPSGAEVPLTSAEFDLLYALVTHPNRVLTRDFLINATRGRSAAPFDRTIDVHIGRLRKKIEPDPQHPTLIKTLRNAGYIFTPVVQPQ